MVHTTAKDAGASFGATAEEIASDLSATTNAAKDDAASTVGDITDKVTDKVGDVVDSAKSAASDVKAAAGKAADAATEAARSAGATIKSATDDVDFDQLVAQTRTVAGEWTEKVKQAYRERPGVVIGAAVGAVVLTTAVLRAIARR